MPGQDVLMVYTTFPDIHSAKRIARELVAAKLAACSNIFDGVTSIYEWDGELVEEGEIVVLFKTTSGRFNELSIELRRRHSYETPAVIGYQAMHVDESYLAWLRHQTNTKGAKKK